jgi:hypothetical protein
MHRRRRYSDGRDVASGVSAGAVGRGWAGADPRAGLGAMCTICVHLAPRPVPGRGDGRIYAPDSVAFPMITGVVGRSSEPVGSAPMRSTASNPLLTVPTSA